MDSTKQFERRVSRTIRDCGLLKKREKVLVACSGGKDSGALLFVLHKFGFRPEALHINLGIGQHSSAGLQALETLCKGLEVRLHVLDFEQEAGFPFRELALKARKAGVSPCTACGIMKRHILNRKAREMGADRLALGHNLDDAAQTVVMNMLTGSITLGLKLGPLTGGSHEKFVPRIKPLFFSMEKDIIAYCKGMGIAAEGSKCPYSGSALRPQIRAMLDSLEERYPGMKMNIARNLMELKALTKGKTGLELGECKKCGEPSLQELCKACRLLEKIKGL
jgi:uncharacterized protein (TIGR00269 family)